MVIGLIVIILFNQFSADQPDRAEIAFSDFLNKVEAGEVRIVLQWIPMLIFIGVWIFFMRRMPAGWWKK